MKKWTRIARSEENETSKNIYKKLNEKDSPRKGDGEILKGKEKKIERSIEKLEPALGNRLKINYLLQQRGNKHGTMKKRITKKKTERRRKRMIQ